MDFTQTMLFVAELIGTVAFAFSGSVLAIHKKLDIFGTLVLGVITAVGGGMIRDITLGIIPPALFRYPIYVGLAALTSLGVFLLCYFRSDAIEQVKKRSYTKIINLMDSIGLGIFSIVGVNVAIQNGYRDSAFLVVAVGAITGVGGGIMRDLLAVRTPVVLHKHVYAVASIAGATVYYFVQPYIPDTIALLSCAGLVILIRLLATHYEWNLPIAGVSKKSKINHE